MNHRVTVLSILFFVTTIFSITVSSQTRWPEQKINNWYNHQPWLVGCNYTPAYAINQLEFWQSETFDTVAINTELVYAEGLGMTTMRVFLHDLVWKADAKGFKKRINQFLSIANRHHIKPFFVFFDDCWKPDPQLGKQPDPVPGKHNSGWVRSPSQAVHNDSTQWGYLEAYVKDILKTFGKDKRILMWDLYNEPGNSDYNQRSLPLLKKAFQWARAVHPSQPLTVAVWEAKRTTITEFSIKQSDVISFHNYGDSSQLRRQIESLEQLRRPLICTEWLARSYGSSVETNLPVFYKYKVGAVNWGFVSGKTNTIYPWSSIGKPFTKEPFPWHHDLLRPGGAPYDRKEMDLFQQLITNSKNKLHEP